VPLIAESARRHGVEDGDIRHAFDNPIRFEALDNGFLMLIGGDRTGNLLEIGVVDSDNGPIIVHAMPARLQYLR
jgi:hypothetical protein